MTVTAELPGMEEKEVELLLEDGVLTLKGEKRAETEDKDRQFSERYYGRFERRISLDAEVQADKVQARFKNGVLTVTLPKDPEAQSKARRITIGHWWPGCAQSKMDDRLQPPEPQAASLPILEKDKFSRRRW